MPSRIVAAAFSNLCPSFSSGRRDVFSSPSSGCFCFRLARKACSIPFHPSCRIVFPLAVNVWPSDSKTASTASKRWGWAVAQRRRQARSIRTSRSPAGKADRSVRAISTVGRMAWWSVTLLSSMIPSSSGAVVLSLPKGIFCHSHRAREPTVACISAVIYWLSVLG